MITENGIKRIEREGMIFIVLVHYRDGAVGVSQEGYKTLEGARDFIKSRSDYNGQLFTNWCVETEKHIYEIKGIQIVE